MPPHYKTALLTGASSGLGQALAQKLAAQGTHVVLCARRADVLQKLAAQLNESGAAALPCALDLCATNEAVSTIRAIDEKVGGLDLVIANAGVAQTHPPAEHSWEDLSGMIRLNFEAALATLLAVLPAMKRRGSGHLVGISSLAAYLPVPGSATYCATKAGLSSFLEGLRLELADSGVRVTAVHPGYVRTPAMANPRVATPLMLECDDAAERILRRLPAAPACIDFPWPSAAIAHATRFAPRTLLHAFLRSRRWVR